MGLLVKGWRARSISALAAAMMLGACTAEFWNEPRDDDVLRVTYEDEITVDIASGGVDLRSVEATAVLQPTRGNEARGIFSLGTDEGGVQLVGSIDGIEAEDALTIRIHERGDCSAPDAASAGGSLVRVAMDALPIRDDGSTALKHVIPGATLGDGGPRDLAHRSIVVHAARPVPATPTASEETPGRIACGVIRLSEHG
jgi:superoxide dismutase, Cu-Zn family